MLGHTRDIPGHAPCGNCMVLVHPPSSSTGLMCACVQCSVASFTRHETCAEGVEGLRIGVVMTLTFTDSSDTKT